MALRRQLNDREFDKFETTSDGKTAVRVALEDSEVNLNGDVAIDVAAFHDASGDDQNALVDSNDRIIIGDISGGTQTNDVKVTLDSETVEVVQDTASDLNMTEANSASIQTAVELIDDAVGTPDSVASGKNVQVGAVAETTVPSAVADGDNVSPWHDEYGRQISYGDNLSVNAKDTNVINQALLNTIEVTMLDAVTATGASSAVDVSNFNKVKFQIVKTDTATVDIQESLDDSTYDNVQTDVDGIVTISDEAIKYVKVNVSAYTSGNVTVKMIGGN